MRGITSSTGGTPRLLGSAKAGAAASGGETLAGQLAAIAARKPASTSSWNCFIGTALGSTWRTLMPRSQATTERTALSSAKLGATQEKSRLKLSLMRASAISALSSLQGSPGMGTGVPLTSA